MSSRRDTKSAAEQIIVDFHNSPSAIFTTMIDDLKQLKEVTAICDNVCHMTRFSTSVIEKPDCNYCILDKEKTSLKKKLERTMEKFYMTTNLRDNKNVVNIG